MRGEKGAAQRRLGFIWLGAYIGTIFAANYVIQRYGIVSVGFGLMAPAAVYFAGLAFTFRDLVHDALGRMWVAGAILVGAILSAVVSPQLALASGVAFLVSEGADFGVYAPLRERGFLRAVVASNVVGLMLDSLIFLWLAFGSLDFFWGQVVGKAWMTFLAVLLLAHRSRRAVTA